LFPCHDLDLVQLCVRVEISLVEGLPLRKTTPNTSYLKKEHKREGHPSKSQYEESRGKERKKEKIKKRNKMKGIKKNSQRNLGHETSTTFVIFEEDIMLMSVPIRNSWF